MIDISSWRVDKGSRKKSYFLSGPTTKALPPPPSIELSGHPFFGTFLRAPKKGILPQWSGLYPPLP